MTSVRAVCLFALVVVATSSCATTSSVGVRRAYTQHTLRRVAVAPVTAGSQFGLRDSQWQTARATYERQILEELRGFGFSVLSPGELERRLRDRGAWQTFTEVLVPQGDISARFEPALYGEEPPLEVMALQKLSQDGDLEADALLLTEVVYHSEGFCDEDPREYNKHAVIMGDPEVPAPCVVSHFEAKLVDPKTGTTMWHNRQLRERRLDELDQGAVERTIRETVSSTLSGPHGLGPLAGTG